MRYKSLFGNVNKFRALFAVLTPEVTSVRRALTEDMRRRECQSAPFSSGETAQIHLCGNNE